MTICRPATVPKVLVLDDDPPVALAVRLMLLSCGMQVVVEHHPERALARLTDEQIDLLITDLRMPGVGGETVCRQVRVTPGLENLPIIVITGIAQLTDVRRLKIELGLTAVLTKPFPPSTLREVVTDTLSPDVAPSIRG